MADHKSEESVPEGSAANDDRAKEARDKFGSGTRSSPTSQEHHKSLTPDTVPRSQYEGVLERLGILERRMQKIDKSVDWNSEDDDEVPGAVAGPWLNGSMLKDIRFLIKTARSQRRIWKEQTKRTAVNAQKNKDAIKLQEKLIDGGESQNAAQVLLGGSKARLTYLDWTSFREVTEEDSKSLLEPIDVLIEEPDVFRDSVYEKKIDIQQETETDPAPRDFISRYFPERIRIHSWLLRKALDETVDLSMGWGTGAFMILRPFKILVHSEPKLRAASKRLRERINAQAEAGSSVLPHLAKTPRQEADVDETAGILSVDLSDPGESQESEVMTQVSQMDDDNDNQNDDQSDNESDNDRGIIHNSATLLHLECLLEFYDTNIQPRLDAIASNDDHKISFDDLWNLFRPGDIVLEQGEKQAYRLIQVITPQHRATSPWARWLNRDDSSGSEDESDDDPLRLECVLLDFDGVQFGPVSKSFRIPRYKGRKHIKSLPVYGSRFSTNADIRQQLIARGRVLLDVATYRSMYYTGLALNSKEEIDSQVVIDFSEALSVPENKAWMPRISPVSTKNSKPRPPCYAECCNRMYVYPDNFVDSERTAAFIQTLLPEQASDQPPLTIHPKSWTDMKKEGYVPDDDELMIMTHRVFAFVLRSRKWAQLDLTHLKYDNEENRRSIESAFQRLVLPEGHKEMVQALVTQHFLGKGLIVLLHGAPGVGKTTTAEGVAEEFKRPLFQITCGDLGTTPAEVQAELEKNFSLASRLGCVLLLDEADVFLAQRERKDLTRNALVAIFLRILEYYTGILFLTTNRVGDFDEAFASRIHMSLHYPALNAEKTQKVFKLNLELIQERMLQQGRHFQIDEDAILIFAEAHYNGHRHGRWNGRQIRNACQTALALAEYESKQDAVFLMTKHFKKVQEAYLDFSRYLGETFGTLGDQRAREDQYRAEEPEHTLSDTGTSIMRADPSAQPPRVAPSPFRATGRQQPAPMQANQPAYAAYQGMQSPQGGQYMPSNQPPRTSQPQMGPGGHQQFGHQSQTWTAQPPMAQPAAQYPYQQPTQLQPPYQQQGFGVQSHQQATDPGLNTSANTDM